LSSCNVFESKEGNIVALCVTVKNGVFVIVSENVYLLGTLAISIPATSKTDKSFSYSLPVFGARNELLARTLSERVSTKLNKVAVVTVNIKNETDELRFSAFKAVDSLISNILKDKKTSS